jgi:inhibitor of cysteine peptidase
MHLDESASGTELRLRAGDTLEVTLAETPTTGYRWRLVSDGAPACRAGSDRFEPPSSMTPGASGRHTFTFTTVQRGAGEIVLVSVRSFGGAEPARRFSVRAVVE